MDILKQTLQKYKPTLKQRNLLHKQITAVLKLIQEELTKKKLKAQVLLGGSAAKGTFIKDDFDCDIFIRFDYEEYKQKDISAFTETILTGFKPKRVHGSRDYFQFAYQGINYEIIPVLYVTNPKKALNVTDMSPSHIDWVQKHMSSALRDEVLLAKLFCKAQTLYGAESYINGFSGHVLDILIIYYGSFLKLLKASLTWNLYDIIDVEKHHTAQSLNESKIAPLILIDPVQPERNAAAALSKEKFLLFKGRASAFLKKPSLLFFTKKKLSLSLLKRKAGRNTLFVFEVLGAENKEDVVGTKILKVFEHYTTELEKYDFTLLNLGWEFDKKRKAIFWYIIQKGTLTKTFERIGPPLSKKQGVKEFTMKYNHYQIRNERLYAHVVRKYRTPDTLFKDLIKDAYTRERVIRVKKVEV